MTQNQPLLPKKYPRLVLAFFTLLGLFTLLISCLFVYVASSYLKIALNKSPESGESANLADTTNNISNPSPIDIASGTISVWPVTPSIIITEPNISLNSTKTPTILVPLVSGQFSSSTLEQLSFGSFLDNFSGVGSMDTDKTTLFEDVVSTALYFPLHFNYTLASPEVISKSQVELEKLQINNFYGPYTEQRCLENNCLENNNNKLSYNGKAIASPVKSADGELVATSLGALETKWLVGFTLKKNGSYAGKVFYFDGQKFSPLNVLPAIESTYFGPFGFGGSDTDFLVIYGAYQGITYHVKNNQAVDTSRFFDLGTRTMNGGFKAEVIKVGAGDATDWYIFSTTSFQPKLIKLWQNKTPEIVGEAVFNSLFPISAESVTLNFLEKTSAKRDLLVKIKDGGQDSYYIFSDLGFKNQAPLDYYSLPITHDGNSSLVTIKKIVDSTLDLDPISLKTVKFYFSADGKTWQDVYAINRDQANLPPLRQYFFKVVFPPVSDRFSSPFLASILFDYYCQK